MREKARLNSQSKSPINRSSKSPISRSKSPLDRSIGAVSKSSIDKSAKRPRNTSNHKDMSPKPTTKRPSSTISQDRVLPARELSASVQPSKAGAKPLEYTSKFANSHFGVEVDRKMRTIGIENQKQASASKNYSSEGKSAKSTSKSPIRKTSATIPRPLQMSTTSLSKNHTSKAGRQSPGRASLPRPETRNSKDVLQTIRSAADPNQNTQASLQNIAYQTLQTHANDDLSSSNLHQASFSTMLANAQKQINTPLD